MLEWAIWGVVVAVINVVLAGGVTIHAVLRKRDSRSVIAWVGLAWLAPLMGTLAYALLGVNRIQRKAVRLNRGVRSEFGNPPRLTPGEERDIARAAVEYPNFVGLACAGRNVTGRRLVSGNTIEPLIDGDESFPEMLAAISHAEKSVSLLSYIFDHDRIGQDFLAALVSAQNRGVEVRVIVDDVGSKYSRPNMVSCLRREGIKAAAFLPTLVPRLNMTTNLRNHRKILVVDGKVGFTGGTNVREGHCLALKPDFPVRCLHFKLQGPIVYQLQNVFAIDWAFVTDEQLEGDQWFPEKEPLGTVWARGIEHGPDEDFEKLVDILVAALSSARHRVRIVTPYFLPHASLIGALNVAALRGIDVEIYIPAVNNIKLVQWACTAQLWQVLEKGCRVFSTPPPFDHTKLMIVDDMWVLLGSTNWDPRSLRLNFEFNVECYSSNLATRLNAIIDDKATHAREITLEEVNRRSVPVQLRDGLARLFKPYL